MTFDNLPPNAQKLVTLVVQQKKNYYPKYNTLVLRFDDDIGVAETREVDIYELYGHKIFCHR